MKTFKIFILGFILSAGLAAQADLKPCGHLGSDAIRIADCQYVNGEEATFNGNWQLVSKDGFVGNETWRDNKTGTVWLPPEIGTFSFTGAHEACKASNATMPTVEDYILMQRASGLKVLKSGETFQFFAKSYSELNNVCWSVGVQGFMTYAPLPLSTCDRLITPVAVRCIRR